jgi:hypothetical protein
VFKGHRSRDAGSTSSYNQMPAISSAFNGLPAKLANLIVVCRKEACVVTAGCSGSEKGTNRTK